MGDEAGTLNTISLQCYKTPARNALACDADGWLGRLKKAKSRLGFHLAFSLFFIYLNSKDPGFKKTALNIPVTG